MSNRARFSIVALGMLSLGAPLVPALADGMPSAPDGTYAATPYSWAGLYAGINGGYSWTGTVDWQYSVGSAPGPFDNDGGFGGLHLGYQGQWGNVVAGVETSIEIGHTSGSNSCPNPAYTCSTEINHFGTALGRLGFAHQNWLFFGQAGYAFASVADKAVSAFASERSSERHDGWAYGGGVEYMISPHMFVGLDYLHLDLGDELHPGVSSGGGTVPRVIDVDLDVVRARLSFKN